MMVMKATLASSGRLGHERHLLADMIHIHARLDRQLAVGLQHALGHALGHLGGGIADIDLAGGDVEGAAVQDGGFGQAGDGVLGRGIGRGMRAAAGRR